MNICSESAAGYIAQVSSFSGLNMSPERQARHVAEFARLAGDAAALNDLMGSRSHLEVGPICLFKHDESPVRPESGA